MCEEFLRRTDVYPDCCLGKALMDVVIVADDFGVNAARTDGIVEAFLRGCITQVSLLVNGEDTHRAAKLARLHGIPIGLHFNITEGRASAPYDSVSTIVTGDFMFLGKINFFCLTTQMDPQLITKCVEHELRAQVALFRSALGWSSSAPVHVDGHHHVHVLPPVWAAFERAAEELRIASVRLPYDPFLAEAEGKKRKQRILAWTPEKCLGHPFWYCICRFAAIVQEESDLLRSGKVKAASCFLGFDLSGIACSKDRVMEKLLAAKNMKYTSVEIMTHVGRAYTGAPTDPFWHCEWSCSKDREHEACVYCEVAPLLREMLHLRLCSFRNIQL